MNAQTLTLKPQPRIATGGPRLMTILSMVALILAAFVAAGCTKERPYEEVAIDKTSQVKPEAKSLIDTTAEYLYVPSNLNSTRTTSSTFPMYMGEAKIVKLQLTEGTLTVVEVEEDDRFNNNPVNAKPVLSIPIEHVDYRCTKDADGKCTNKEEEDKSKPWAKRSYVKLQADKFAVQEINYLPMEIDNLFYPCYQEVGAAFAGYKIDETSINISVEKSYKADLACADNISSLSDLTFRVVNHYSFVKLNSITSPDYKALNYRRSEETTFGYFDTKTLKLDRDNNATEQSEKAFVNRWNPNRTVTYQLTSNFNKPEHAKIKAATYQAFENINTSLKLAGAKMRVALKDGAPDMNPGDLRVSSVVMVEDPVNYGILGYGPTAANPRTGEIVHGRAAMYLGVIKTGIRRAYEEVVAEKISKIEKAKADAKTHATADGSGRLETQESKTGPFILAEGLKEFKGARPQVDAREFMAIKAAIATKGAIPSLTPHTHSHSAERALASSAGASRASSGPVQNPVDKKKIQARTLRQDSRRLTIRDAAMMKEDPTIKEQILSTHCFYDIDNFNMNEVLEKEIEALVADLGAKPWTELSETEKDRVIDTLIPFVWVPTLIHEVGHTLGLRHNFAGSEDKANFYSKQELAEMGIQREFTYSSVMDYGYRATNELQVMGKYDIAALRFGYAEKVELADGSLISIEQFRASPTASLKEYKYCTDEHVAVNPFCKRFDEGTSLVEIATHWINMYEQNYLRRNFRNGLKDFSLYGDAAHISRLNNVMNGLRVMFERYDDIKNTFGLADDAAEWETIDFLNDLKQSSRMAGHFFIKVLETPDLMCAVAQTSRPNTIVAVVPIRVVSHNAMSCFDKENIGLNPAYTIVGEAGKSFQSRKDPRAGNPYIDQIDVRGIWLDKLLAARSLVKRMTGIETFDDHTNNFLDLKDMREPVEKALAHILADEVVTAVPIYTASGQTLVAQLGVKFFDAAEAQNSHKIAKPLHPGVQAYFSIPSKGVDFQAKLIQILLAELPSREQKSDATSLYNSLVVHVGLPTGSAGTDYMRADIGLQGLFINLKSKVASGQAVNRDIVSTLSGLGEEKLAKILEDLETEKPAAEDATDAEKMARALGAEVIQKFLEGGYQDKTFYEVMLQAMAG